MTLCQATPTVIQMLEDHYSTVRHTEGALTLDQLGYCDWGVGTSRIPEGITNAPPIWKMIMDVKAEAIEEFAWNLAVCCVFGAHACPIVHIVCRGRLPHLAVQGASSHSGLHSQDRASRRCQETQDPRANDEAKCHGLVRRLLCVCACEGAGPEAVRHGRYGEDPRPVAQRVARLKLRVYAMSNCVTCHQ
jgi:hypothetical protein